MSKKVSSSRDAWAIQCQWPGEKPFLCGVMFWAWRNGDAEIPFYLRACRTAVFRTRLEARNACSVMRTDKNKAKVVKIKMTITVEA